MAKKEMRIIIRLRSTESPHVYITSKNRQTHPERMERKKYDPVVRRHVTYKEAR